MNVTHLTEYLEDAASRSPSRIAIVDSADRVATYAELNRQANALAAFLHERGVRTGDRVGVLLPKSIAAVATFFGVLKAGAAYVPMDVAAPAERNQKILSDCQMSALIIDNAMYERMSLHLDVPLRAVLVTGDATDRSSIVASLAEVMASPADNLILQRRPDDLAYIIYTSGSTGTPKGVMITHANAISYIEWCSSLLKPTEDDRFSSYPPFHFDASVQDIYVTIKHGASMYLIGDDLAKNPRTLAGFIDAHRLTIWTSTPPSLMLLLQFADLQAHDFSSLRVVLVGGEVFPVKHLRQLATFWRSAVFYNVYGPTEATTICTFARIPDVIPADRTMPYPIGFPCDHCRAVALDSDGQEVPDGQPGVLHIAGPSVSTGYWNRPNETEAAFSTRNGERWYNTGDVVSWNAADGFTFLGRNDRMVKRRGFRIELGEIESALYSHPHVREAAVVAFQNGDDAVKIGAFLSCRPNATLTIVELKTFCASVLPSYMVPDRFIVADQLPLTSTEKVDYQQLKTLLSTPPTILRSA